ncbi:excalibur calcium-binding domain-containing protein [Tsuneonella sp. HG222]
MRHIILAVAFSSLFVGTPAAHAHPGGLAADGCHMERKTGQRHCHGASASALRSSSAARLLETGSASFPNCAAARAAGAAPVRRGQSGYGGQLDRDGDGIGCE